MCEETETGLLGWKEGQQKTDKFKNYQTNGRIKNVFPGWTPSRVDRGTAQGSGGSPAKCLFQPELATSPGLKVEVSP